MAKHRKTRQEKIATQQKRQDFQFSYSYSPTFTPRQGKSTGETNSSRYVLKDIKRTFIVSSALIILQLLLLIFLQHRVIKIPGVIY